MSIIEILIGIYSIVFVDKVLESQLKQINDTISGLSSGMAETFSNLLSNVNNTSIIVSSIICIVLASILLVVALKDIENSKNKLIGLTIAIYVFAINQYAGLLAVIGLVIALTMKSNKETIKKEKTKIPVLEKHGTSVREIVIGILFVLIYFSDYLWGNYIPKSITIPIVILFEILLIILAIFIYYKDLKRDVIELKSNFKAYFIYALKTWGMMLLGIIFCALILSVFTNIEESTNQQLLKELPLLYVIPSAIIMAPIVEETIFRVIFRKIIRNDILFIIISGISFGALHVLHESSVLDAAISSISYVVMGMFMARCYVKTNNVTTSMIVHFMQNAMASIFTFLI